MENQGFIKLSRKYFDNFLWKEPRVYSKAEAWLDLIYSARFEASTELINNRVIEVHRGEIPASRRFLEERWKWGSTKVANFIDILTKKGMINQRQDQGQTILILCKYDSYNDTQTSDKPPIEPATNHQQTSDKPEANQRQTKDKEYKKERIKEDINIPLNPPEEKLNPESGKIKKPKKEVAELKFPFSSEKFMTAWGQLVSTPKWKKKIPYTLQLALNQLSKYEEEFAIKMIEAAAANDWQGVVFPQTDEQYVKWKTGRNTGKSNFANHDNTKHYEQF